MPLPIADKLLLRQHEFLSHLGKDCASFSQPQADFCLSSKEAHHRIKNNLQIIAGLISLQAQQADHPKVKTALQLAQARLTTFTRLHDTLSRSDHGACLDLGAYFQELTTALRAVMGIKSATSADDNENSGGPLLELYLEAPEIIIPSSMAVDMGMALNELVTNACKHAFPDRDGEIRIVCRKNGPYLDLYVSDNGQGMDMDVSADSQERAERSESLGMAIVRQIAAKYQSQFTLSPQTSGTRAHIRFPLPSQDIN